MQETQAARHLGLQHGVAMPHLVGLSGQAAVFPGGGLVQAHAAVGGCLVHLQPAVERGGQGVQARGPVLQGPFHHPRAGAAGAVAQVEPDRPGQTFDDADARGLRAGLCEQGRARCAHGSRLVMVRFEVRRRPFDQAPVSAQRQGAAQGERGDGQGGVGTQGLGDDRAVQHGQAWQHLQALGVPAIEHASAGIDHALAGALAHRTAAQRMDRQHGPARLVGQHAQLIGQQTPHRVGHPVRAVDVRRSALLGGPLGGFLPQAAQMVHLALCGGAGGVQRG